MKFFELFQVFHLVNKQVYKLILLTKYKIYDIFYILLFEPDITRKRQINKLLKLEKDVNLDIGKDKEYKIKIIKNSII